jgi:hypothetical protein
VDGRNIKKWVEQRCSLDTSGDAFWVNMKSQKHRNGLCETKVQQIMDFWTSRTTISPNAKNITRKRVGMKQYEEHATHYLQISHMNFLPNFELVTGG